MSLLTLRVIALALTAAIVCLHFIYVTKAGGLWRDEANTAAFASMPSLSAMWAHLPFESFPMLWPMVVRIWQAFGGESDLALRMLGCAVGVGIIGALWFNARLLKLSAPLVSLALLGFNPIVIRAGDSLRAYGLGLLLILLTFALIWRVATAPTKWSIALVILAAIGSAQALYHNAVVLLAIGVAGAVVAARRRQWGRVFAILAIGAASAVSLLPYLGPIQRARSWDVVSTRDFSVSIFSSRVFDAMAGAGWLAGWLWIAVLAAAAVIAIVWQFTAPRDEEPTQDLALYAAVAALVAVGATFGFLRFVGYPTQPWYYLPLLGLLAISADSILSTVRHPIARDGLRVLSAIGVAAASCLPTWQALQLRQTNIDLIGEKLRASAVSGDVVVTMPWYLGVSLRRYYEGPAEITTVPPMPDLRVQRYDVLKTQMESLSAVDPVLAAIEKALKSGNRVWIVGNLLFPPEGQPPPVLAPAPFEKFGWDEGAYMNAWMMQTGHFLREHATAADEIPITSAQPINPHETAQLIAVRGWR